MASYTCPHCQTTSATFATQAEADQMLATHQQVRHGSPTRREATTTTTRTSRRTRRDRNR